MPMEWLVNLLGTAGGAALVGGILAIIQWRMNRKAQKEDKAAEIKVVDCTARGEEIDKLRIMVENLTTANRVSMYDRIKHIAKTYIKRGWCTFEEYEDLKLMHNTYHNELNGNGFLDAVMQAVDNLEKRVQ